MLMIYQQTINVCTKKPIHQLGVISLFYEMVDFKCTLWHIFLPYMMVVMINVSNTHITSLSKQQNKDIQAIKTHLLLFIMSYHIDGLLQKDVSQMR